MAAPTNTVAPAVSVSGGTATSTTGVWANTPTGYSYQWIANGSDISGATSSTYTLAPGDYGKAIACVVTASNTDGGNSATSSNAATPTPFQAWLRPSNLTSPATSGPILTPVATWETPALNEGTALIDTTEWKLYYHGGWTSAAMGLATCPLASNPTVAANWTKYTSNPVLGQGGSGYAGYVGTPNVVKVSGTYYCYFNKGSNSDLMVSTSSDGLAWSTPEIAIAHNQVSWASGYANTAVWTDASGWYMLVESDVVATGHFGIGYATSADGLAWTVQAGPFASLLPPSATAAGGPWLVQNGQPVNGALQLWWHVSDGASIQNAATSDPSSDDWCISGLQLLNAHAGYAIGNPCLVEHAGTSYFFYGIDHQNTPTSGDLYVASFAGNLTDFLTTNAVSTLTADFEKGTNGATILATDPGSLSAWDTVGGSPTYTNTNVAHGLLAAALVSGSQNFMRWGASWPGLSDFYGRFYIYYGSNPASQQNVCQIHCGSNNIKILVNAAGTLMVGVGIAGATSTTALTVGNEYRIEFHFIASTTAASGEVKIFSGDSATPLETFSVSGTTNSATTTNHDFGEITTGITWTGVVLDQIVSACTAYPGPFPVIQTQPTVSGSTPVGSTLTCDGGTWNGTFTLSYQWTRGGADIVGATASSYTTVTADVGKEVGCTVTATGQQAVNESASSASSNTITPTGGGPVVDANTGQWIPRVRGRVS